MADDDDDPQLRSMRAAWRSLPQEDPPERGLAELMAAARRHAEAMVEARTPWWKRALAILRRPAVLALASVLVLLGGVFAVTATHKGVSPEPAGIEQTEMSTAKPQAAAAPGTGGLAQPADPTPTPAAVAPPAISTAKPKAAPTHHAATRALAPPPPPPAPAPAPVQQLAAPAAAADDEGDAPAPATRGAVSKSTSSDAASSPRRQLDTQLLAQCRAAAARGDCETAKKIAQRIQADDAAYYVQSVAPDAALAKCLSK